MQSSNRVETADVGRERAQSAADMLAAVFVRLPSTYCIHVLRSATMAQLSARREARPILLLKHRNCNSRTRSAVNGTQFLCPFNVLQSYCADLHDAYANVLDCVLKCDGTRAETRFRLSAKWTIPFKSAGTSVQSTSGSRGVRISCSNVEYIMFRGSVKSTGYPLHSPVTPSLPLPCVTVCHHVSTGLYNFVVVFVRMFQFGSY